MLSLVQLAAMNQYGCLAGLPSTNMMWNGTLDDGTHISQGAYWWRVAATKSLGNYVQVIFTQQSDIQFTP